jgi:hypothetical protein
MFYQYFIVINSGVLIIIIVHLFALTAIKELYGKLHNENLYNLYALSNSVTIFKPRVLRSAEYVARMRKQESIQNILVLKT